MNTPLFANMNKQLLESEWGSLRSVAGVRLATVPAGIRYKGRDDVVLLEVSDESQVVGVFTQNAFCAAPVVVAKQHLEASEPRFLLVNAGNANAGTGQAGINNANASCEAVGEQMHCSANQVLPFSTGVIGEHLPVDKIVEALPKLKAGLSENNWQAAARAIMTTDTAPKAVTRSAVIDGHSVTVTGIAKGAGMICPNMATLLSFIATDAAVSKPLLQSLVGELASNTFNRITVDGDTSTNDACILIATGKSKMPILENDDDERLQPLQDLLHEVFNYLAVAIICDAEGASKLVNVAVLQGANSQECDLVARTIAHSPLVKTALFASDPNWGRILAAVGRAGLEHLEINKIKILLNGVCIVSDGGRDNHYREEMGASAMKQDRIDIEIHLGRGTATANIWTCDLSYDYVKINAEYRT